MALANVNQGDPHVIAHNADRAVINTLSAERINVKTYGAVGDGVVDDNAAFTNAIAAADAAAVNHDFGPVIYCPPGIYTCREQDLTNLKTLIVGDGPQRVRIRYNGTGGAGTALFKTTTNVGGAISHGGFKGVYLDGKSAGVGNPKCANLYKKTGNTGYDLFFTMEQVSIANALGDGFDFGTGNIVNLHIDRLRIDGSMGWGLRLAGTTTSEHRPITINRFTIDCGTVGTLKGLMRVDNGRGYYIRISNGRLEGNASLLDETIGGVTEKSWILNVNTLASSYGAYYWLDNVMGYTQAADTTALVRDASGFGGSTIRGRLDVVNFDNTEMFRADGRAANNVGVVSPQDMTTRFFVAN